jgi:hypothetical protein
MTCFGCNKATITCLRTEDLIPVTQYTGDTSTGYLRYLFNVTMDAYNDKKGGSLTPVSNVDFRIDYCAKIRLSSYATEQRPSTETRPSFKCDVWGPDPSLINTNYTRVWEFQQSQSPENRKANPAWQMLASCSLSPNSSLATNDLLDWALKATKAMPAGAIGKSHGQLFNFAALYSASKTRPLVSITTFHTSERTF